MKQIGEYVRAHLTNRGTRWIPRFSSESNSRTVIVHGEHISLTDTGSMGVSVARYDLSRTKRSWDHKIYPKKRGILSKEKLSVSLGRGIRAWFIK